MNSGTTMFNGRLKSRLSRTETTKAGVGLIHARSVRHGNTAWPRFNAA